MQDLVWIAASRESRGRSGILYLDNQPTNLYTYQRVISKLTKKLNISKQAIYYRLAELKLLNNQLTEKSIRDVSNNLKL